MRTASLRPLHCSMAGGLCRGLLLPLSFPGSGFIRRHPASGGAVGESSEQRGRARVGMNPGTRRVGLQVGSLRRTRWRGYGRGGQRAALGTWKSKVEPERDDFSRDAFLSCSFLVQRWPGAPGLAGWEDGDSGVGNAAFRLSEPFSEAQLGRSGGIKEGNQVPVKTIPMKELYCQRYWEKIHGSWKIITQNMQGRNKMTRFSQRTSFVRFI
ncbi:uncharacterized protein LOC142865529 [Microcebus murinus]|uniref:uncharacterized protein LOC142865529 n=1 Tax=Microcebus murinus TaxID=30608 RepID=UPI003F6D77B0